MDEWQFTSEVVIARDADVVGFHLDFIETALDFEFLIYVTHFHADVRREHVLRFHHTTQGVVELHVIDLGRAAAAQLGAGDIAQAGADLPLLANVVESQGFDRVAIEMQATVLRGLVIHMEVYAGLCGKLLIDAKVHAAGEIHAGAGPDAGGVAVGVLGSGQFVAAGADADADEGAHGLGRGSSNLCLRGGGDCQCGEGEYSFFHAKYLVF